MNDRIKLFWLGVFLIAAIFVIGWLIIFLRPTYGNGETHLRVRFTNVDKVIVGTRVTFAGYPVGEVKRINEIANARETEPNENNQFYFFELDLDVDSSVHVFTYDEIVFSTSGLLGDKSINIIPRPAPRGSPRPSEITDCVLYATSEDKMDQVLNQMLRVSKSFDTSLKTVRQFFDENREKASEALDHISKAMGKTETFFEAFTPTAEALDKGEGTLSNLINSNDFYVRMNAVLIRLEMLLSDMNRFGVLYQFSGKWRRSRDQRESLNNFAKIESHQKISESLSKISSLLRAESSPDPENKDILNQLDQLTQDVTKQNEKLLAEYNRK